MADEATLRKRVQNKADVRKNPSQERGKLL